MFCFKSFLQERIRNEFDAEFQNHPLGNQNIYRLHYIEYYRKNNYAAKYRTIDWPFDLFIPPTGMSREDMFKVLSYLTDYIECKSNLKPCSYKSVATLNYVLTLKRLGFTKLDLDKKYDETEFIDLWTVAGRVLLFKESPYYSKYFNWYSENITLEEVQSIYKKINIDFYDLIPNYDFSNQGN